MSYNLFKYKRRDTSVANVGKVGIGGENPIRVQTMVTTLTSDVDATVVQCIKVIQAGAEIVRITVPSKKDAEYLNEIQCKLLDLGFDTPLVADIHFNPEAALLSAKYVSKVRINPGNFADKQARLSEQTSKDSQTDTNVLREKFLELLDVCKENKTALRIGTNHGSLSSRIMEKYGDTPEGMVESAMEFLRICKEVNFADVVVSMKASNTRIMVQAYRQLVIAMDKEDMNFPLHLGVTEAGDGEDGRVKSAVGMGTLLADGIGDTIRVSLTEPSENEIPVAKTLIEHFSDFNKHERIREVETDKYFPLEYNKRKSHAINNIGGKNTAVVIADLSTLNPIHQSDIESLGFALNNGEWETKDGCPDYIYTGTCLWNCTTKGLNVIDDDSEDILFCDPNAINNRSGLDWIKSNEGIILIIESENINKVADLRAFFIKLASEGITNPVIIRSRYNESDFETLQIKASCDLGPSLIDGFGDGIMIDNTETPKTQLTALSYSILQASRVRFTKTEFIACPGCGRTLFGLRETLEKVREATSHLKGLKIGIMGCIVNGPGEMADADYGYVGVGKGKVSLYKGKLPVKNNIPQEEAIKELIELIKENGDWQEKS